MKAQNTKSRKLLVKLVDEQGHIYSKIFSIELDQGFNEDNFNTERIEIAKEFVKPYPNALFQLASGLIASQTNEFDKIKILADSTLDSDLKIRFVSDYNASTAKRAIAFNNLHPKAKAYRAEKGLKDITIEKFLLDFSPIDGDEKKYNPYQYVTLSEDQKSFTMNAVKLEGESEASDK